MKHEGYVYKWTNVKTGMMYIGSHNGKNPYYIGSGKDFKKDYYQNPDDWVREIIYRGPDIRKIEKEWIIKEGAVDSSFYYNDTTITVASFEGKAHSVEARQKIGEASRNRSAETLRKMSESLKGRTISDETRKKRSESLKGKNSGPQKIVTCPHCGKSGGNVMYRHHFDNCKNV